MEKEFFESYYRTYNSEDPQALSEFYHEDVVIRSAQGEQTGKETMVGTYKYIISKFTDQMTPKNIIIQGDQAAIEIHDRFEAKEDVDDFLGQKFAKGDTFELNLCAVYKVEGNKIKDITIYTK
jgi:hypothetical protein